MSLQTSHRSTEYAFFTGRLFSKGKISQMPFFRAQFHCSKFINNIDKYILIKVKVWNNLKSHEFNRDGPKCGNIVHIESLIDSSH